MKYYSIFSERLKSVLDSCNMTQSDLARKAGLTEVTISRYVTGHRIPGAMELMKIAQALKVSCDYLLGIIDQMNGYYMSDEEKMRAIRKLVDESDEKWDTTASDYLKMINSIIN